MGSDLSVRRVVMIDRINRFVRRWVDRLEVGLVLAAFALVLLLQVPWLEPVFSSVGITNSEAARTTLILAVLAGIMLHLRRMSELLSRRTSSSGRQYFPDPIAVYPHMLENATELRGREKTIDVLGLTLYTAWPSLSFWLGRADINGWRVRMTAIDPNCEALEPWVPSDWYAEARTNLEQIKRASTNAELTKRRIKLETYTYDFVPHIHGFRLGNGDLYISYLLWRDDNKVDKEGYTYEYVPAGDPTDSSEALRRLFASWFDHAVARGQRNSSLQT